MANTTARSKKDVDSMTRDEKIWDSLNYSYGKKRENSEKEYDKAISQTQNDALKRGMGRSSYALQTQANLGQKKVDASNDIFSEQIADYENRLQQMEEAEEARAFQTSEREAQQAWQAEQNRLQNEFTAGQNKAQMDWQSQENAYNRAFNTSEREAQQAYQSRENELARAYSTAEREAQQRYNTSERIAQQIYNTGEREQQQAWQSQENAYNREYSTAEREAQQAYQSRENELARAFEAQQSERSLAQNQAQFDAQLAYNREQAAIQNAQWERQFGYNAESNEQQIAIQYVLNAAQQGGDVTDDLLARAGISRADYNALKKSSGGSGTKSGTKKPWETLGITEEEYNRLMNGETTTPTTGDSVTDGINRYFNGNGQSTIDLGAIGRAVGSATSKTINRTRTMN